MSPWKKLFRILASTLFGGFFYSVWLGIFLVVSPDGGLLELLLWLVAPIITAIGFAMGIIVFNHFGELPATPFLRLLSWPLLGCIIGAAVVYWFGPMLIVFSMLALGTLSIATREVISSE